MRDSARGPRPWRPRGKFLGQFSIFTGPIFEVRGADALQALREEIAGRHRIVVKGDKLDYADISLEQKGL